MGVPPGAITDWGGGPVAKHQASSKTESALLLVLPVLQMLLPGCAWPIPGGARAPAHTPYALPMHCKIMTSWQHSRPNQGSVYLENSRIYYYNVKSPIVGVGTIRLVGWIQLASYLDPACCCPHRASHGAKPHSLQLGQPAL